MNIVEFLEARIAEEEAVARESQQYEQDVYEAEGWFDCTRVLAECKAKRAIIEIFKDRCPEVFDGEKWVSPLTALAAVYADHPDYNPEWRHA